MQYDEFIRQVQDQANLESPDEGAGITRAVLETLGERLDRTVRDGVEAQLPRELKGFLLNRAGPAPERYNLVEFYKRVGARADLKYYDAAERTWQVFAVLKQAIPEGEVQDILKSLPEEFGELFGKDTPGQVRPKP